MLFFHLSKLQGQFSTLPLCQGSNLLDSNELNNYIQKCSVFRADGTPKMSSRWDPNKRTYWTMLGIVPSTVLFQDQLRPHEHPPYQHGTFPLPPKIQAPPTRLRPKPPPRCELRPMPGGPGAWGSSGAPRAAATGTSLPAPRCVGSRGTGVRFRCLGRQDRWVWVPKKKTAGGTGT